MNNIKLTNKNFLGVAGYHHVEIVSIVDLIARDIISGNDEIEIVEFALSKGIHFEKLGFIMEAV